jgi:hypothetical protein
MGALESLREKAREMQIHGWEEMGHAELEAAIQTAREEAKDADDPLKATVGIAGEDETGRTKEGAMEETFTCDDCGREFPRRQLKEVVNEDGSKLELCPECLDKRMNAADEVRGGPGEEKQAAAYLDEAAEQATYGTRR